MTKLGATTKEKPEGWGFITNSRKWHYYKADGRSLCRRYMKWSMSDLEQGNDDSADNCAECRRLRKAALSIEQGEKP